MDLLSTERKTDNAVLSARPKETAKHSSGAACVCGLRSNVHSRSWPDSQLPRVAWVSKAEVCHKEERLGWTKGLFHLCSYKRGILYTMPRDWRHMERTLHTSLRLTIHPSSGLRLPMVGSSFLLLEQNTLALVIYATEICCPQSEASPSVTDSSTCTVP